MKKISPFKNIFNILLLLSLLLFLPNFALCANLLQNNVIQNWQTKESVHFQIFYLKDEKYAQTCLEIAERSYQEILKDFSGENDFWTGEKIKIKLCPSSEVFEESTFTPEWILAIAKPYKKTIVLRPPSPARSFSEISKLLRHECTHIILANLEKKERLKIPLWLNEGLAICSEKGFHMGYSWILCQATIGNSLIPFDEISEAFPTNKWKSQLAYAQSLSFTNFLKDQVPHQNLREFIKKICKDLLPRLPYFEDKWKRSIEKRYTWIIIITGSTFLWSVILILFILTYLKKLYATRKKLKQWEFEEGDFYKF